MDKKMWENLRAASTPGGIEKQEADEQEKFVNKEILPKEIISNAKEDFEAMGITFHEDYDDLFVNVKLPKGWEKVPTDHSMWSDLIDDKGRKRASIFYKGAFYDRKAHISLNRRFKVNYEPEDKYENNDLSFEDRDNGGWYGYVKDGDKYIFKTKIIKSPSYEEQDALREEAEKWLSDKYPLWEDPTKYWD